MQAKLIHHIATDGGTLAVEVQGTGPLVICAPGMGDLRDCFSPLADQLVAAGYTAALMDVRGHGDSTATFNRYGDEATSDDFILVVEQLAKNKEGRAIFAGDSFSAGAAVIAAGKRPDLVSGIILLGPFLRLPVHPFIASAMQVLFWWPWGPNVWQMYAKTLWLGLGDKAADRAALSTQHLTRPGHWAAFQATVAGADHRVVGPWISKVQVPALVVMGDKDPDWSDPVAEAGWVASQFRENDTLIVPGCGHAPMFENPELVGERVLQFLKGIKTK
ncbi:hypothetical protein ANO11243_042180 [Dothideomycetidae sp. 11243]|nr:hypothetical protein ANO11243_042180 [fungal sp. No.11243]